MLQKYGTIRERNTYAHEQYNYPHFVLGKNYKFLQIKQRLDKQNQSY